MIQEGKPLAVVCLSLGGTKLQVGALTRYVYLRARSVMAERAVEDHLGTCP